jgi:hypothetical protein
LSVISSGKEGIIMISFKELPSIILSVKHKVIDGSSLKDIIIMPSFPEEITDNKSEMPSQQIFKDNYWTHGIKITL